MPQHSGRIQLVGGGGHSFVVADGNVWAAGWNKSGQLGVGDTNNRTRFVRLDLMWPTKTLACGWNHSLFLNEGGEVFGCGSNEFGQIAQGDLKALVAVPVKITGFPTDVKVVNIACGLRHSLAVGSDGVLYGWGDSRKRQLGSAAAEPYIIKPTVVFGNQAELKVLNCSAGRAHSLAVLEDHTFILFGVNKNNQLGDEDASVSMVRLHLPGTIGPFDVFCGWDSSLVRSVFSDEVFGWGRNDYGQLGKISEDGKERHPCHVWSHVRTMSVGSEHVLALSDGGSLSKEHIQRLNCIVNLVGVLYSWGWNEHGNCGDGTEANCLTKPTVVAVPKEISVFSIGCGYGMSMMCTIE